MIYYPLSVLMEAGIKDILVITTKEDNENFKRLLGSGEDFGINIEYAIQPSPDGLAQAFIIGEDFIGDETCSMVLGDNIFYGSGLKEKLSDAVENAENGYATIFGYQVHDPERFGIMEFEETEDGIFVKSVEEKPENPKSDYAITGLYFYPKGVSELAKEVKPSDRGELEITSLNDLYRQREELQACLLESSSTLGDGYTWFDTGTFESMNDASNMIGTVQNNRDAVICCPEAIAYQNGWIDDEKIEKASKQMGKNTYGKYLTKVLSRGRR